MGYVRLRLKIVSTEKNNSMFKRCVHDIIFGLSVQKIFNLG
jgi:hypothetical protein